MKFTQSITFKLIFIGVLVLLLMIPSLMINGIIWERESRASNVVREISDKWGNAQSILGPIVEIPYETYVRNSEGEVISRELKTTYILPENLEVESKITPEIRKRGIFEAVLYQGDLKFKGAFPSKEKIPNADFVDWNGARIVFKISDLRGLAEVPELKYSDQTISLKSLSNTQLKPGIGASFSLPEEGIIEFETKLSLKGSESVYFYPLGTTTTVNLDSSWPSPSFDGNFLPESKAISENGFTASWNILELNRSFPQVWSNEIPYLENSKFGVKFIQVAEGYQQTERAIKYAILFIFLTFISYFLVEVLNKFKIHPIQYLLVGFALVLFYLLLLSISEHYSFNFAYLSSAIAITALISSYSASILKKKKLGVMLGILLSTLYIYLYVLLQLEDFALLIGAIGLLAILALVMFITRKIDWYQINKSS